MPWRPRLIPAVALALAWSAAIPVATFAVTPTTAPSTQPVEEPQAADDAPAPTLTSPSIASVVKLSLQDRMLSMTTDLPMLEVETQLKIADFPGKTTANISGTPDSPNISIRHEIDLPPSTAIIYTISSLQHRVMLAVDSENATELRSVQFIQAGPVSVADPEDPPVKLFVSIKGSPSVEKPVELKLVADDVVQLRRKYPRETTEYLQPLLAALRQETVAFAVDHREAWQVLQKHLTVDPKVADQVKKLLADLDADDYATREAASESLDKLGEPAALAVIRMQRAKLSSEQNSRLDAFLARFKPLPEAEAVKRAGDMPFLLDCLYTDDTAMRELVVKQLRETTSRTVDLPTNAPATIWLPAVRKFSKELLAGTTTTLSRVQQ